MQNDPFALTANQKSTITIAAFAARGELDRLDTALREGLDAGLTVSEIKEILVQVYAYAGFPRSLNALGRFMTVLEERKAAGIEDDTGPEASPLPSGKSPTELGTEIQTELVGRPVTGGLYEFSPTIDQFLKGHLFGAIFGRGVLDYQSRELATVGMLANMDGVAPQLGAHFAISMNVGLTEEQLKGVVEVLRANVGERVGEHANAVLQALLNARSQ